MTCKLCGGWGGAYGNQLTGTVCPACGGTGMARAAVSTPAEKTLLDEFATAAMQGICANVPLEKFAQDVLDEKYDNERQNNAYAFVAYSYAAAMMRERNRRDEMGNVKEATEQ